MKAFHDKERGIGITFDDTYLVNGARTPFGKYCGSLAQVSPIDLGIYASKAALERSDIAGSEIDQAIMANIGQSCGDSYFLPRHIALFAGVPMAVPALMVQRICASGFETIITAAEQIALAKADVCLCCGTETMSLAPTAAFGNRMGYPLGKPAFVDMLWEALMDTAAGYPMGYTAENVAAKFGITRAEADEFALTSYTRALSARDRKFFEEEITTVKPTSFEMEGLKTRKVRMGSGIKECSVDEHVRATTAEALAKLPTVFSDTGVLTPGNCSGIVDGSAAVVVASKSYLDRSQKPALARVVAAASSGIDPKIMGLGPVPATRIILEMTGLSIDDIGLFEINEAFSAQVIGCERELGLDRDKLNVNGGAIAIGHPLAATGTRLSLTIARSMIERKVRYGIASACIGGGQGTAILFENTQL